jgi:hypothetical protein
MNTLALPHFDRLTSRISAMWERWMPWLGMIATGVLMDRWGGMIQNYCNRRDWALGSGPINFLSRRRGM